MFCSVLERSSAFLGGCELSLILFLLSSSGFWGREKVAEGGEKLGLCGGRRIGRWMGPRGGGERSPPIPCPYQSCGTLHSPSWFCTSSGVGADLRRPFWGSRVLHGVPLPQGDSSSCSEPWDTVSAILLLL